VIGPEFIPIPDWIAPEDQSEARCLKVSLPRSSPQAASVAASNPSASAGGAATPQQIKSGHGNQTGGEQSERTSSSR